MNSKDINAAINELDEHGCNESDIYESCIGGKIIPYIGWFWRTVNFDSDYCCLGVLPAFNGEFESNDSPKVGFMQNNKWFYDEFKVEGDEWKMLKELIIIAVKKKDADSFRAVDLYMQSLLPDKYR